MHIPTTLRTTKVYIKFMDFNYPPIKRREVEVSVVSAFPLLEEDKIRFIFCYSKSNEAFYVLYKNKTKNVMSIIHFYPKEEVILNKELRTPEMFLAANVLSLPVLEPDKSTFKLIYNVITSIEEYKSETNDWLAWEVKDKFTDDLSHIETSSMIRDYKFGVQK